MHEESKSTLSHNARLLSCKKNQSYQDMVEYISALCSRSSCKRPSICNMQLLRQKMISNSQLFKDAFELQDKIRSSVAFFYNVLEVDSVGDVKNHVNHVHVYNVFQLHTVRWFPVPWFTFYVPEFR